MSAITVSVVTVCVVTVSAVAVSAVTVSAVTVFYFLFTGAGSIVPCLTTIASKYGMDIVSTLTLHFSVIITTTII